MLLKTLAIVMIYFWFKVIVYNFLKLFTAITKNKKAKKLTIRMGREMFYTELIGIYIGGLMEILIASVLTIKFGKFNYSGEKISIGLTILAMPVFSLWLPLVLALITFKFSTKILANE